MKKGRKWKQMETCRKRRISYDNGGQSNGGDKEHNGNGNESSHVKGGSYITCRTQGRSQ